MKARMGSGRSVGRGAAALVFAGSLLVAACVGNEPLPLDCRFFPPEETEAPILACASPGAHGRLELSAEALAAVAERDAEGPVALLIGGAFHYANARGRVVPVLPYDNGPDPFVEGYARMWLGGKIGFVDERLSQRIPPIWDFAYPFEGGTARVCLGCSFLDAGEHEQVHGGVWGRIDPRGKQVVPIQHAGEDLPPAP